MLQCTFLQSQMISYQIISVWLVHSGGTPTDRNRFMFIIPRDSLKGFVHNVYIIYFTNLPALMNRYKILVFNVSLTKFSLIFNDELCLKYLAYNEKPLHRSSASASSMKSEWSRIRGESLVTRGIVIRSRVLQLLSRDMSPATSASRSSPSTVAIRNLSTLDLPLLLGWVPLICVSAYYLDLTCDRFIKEGQHFGLFTSKLLVR